MAIASQSYLHELQSSINETSTYSSSNNNNAISWSDYDDDASFEVSEVPNAFSSDINLAEAISSIEREHSFTNTNNVTDPDEDGDSTRDSGSTGENTGINNLKQDLRTKIQTRRLSQGVAPLRVTFEPPKSYPLSNEERIKVESRKKRNRDSANKSRMKRKRYEDTLLEEVKRMQETNDKLEEEILSLKKTKHTFQKILDNHVSTYHQTPSTTTTLVSFTSPR